VPLDAGDNELLVGVANDFYGWGIVARLDSLAGLTLDGQPADNVLAPGELR
jgi:hypothetical protein